ncbi:DUF3558 domain-containing protein [Nocardia anaemiae]|uniref:DUF3558 domain-containing protein n=1 Tax=Nocardia anaemiae TaxID=263910 RepID=UPI000A006343|nr:DUF3558 domain-containing protein [Nocardia anaemiae]
MMRIRPLLALLALTAMPLAASCSSNSDTAQDQVGSGQTTSSSAPSARPTLTNPKLQPPSQDNKYTASTGRPKVVFDPCTWISDDAARRAGFDPASRARGDDLVAEYSFLTCDFLSTLRTLQLNSGNASWEEDLAKVGSYSEPITVNGRQALLVRDPQVSRNCQIDLRTKVGFVQVDVYLTDRAPQNLNPCDGITDIASTIEPEIGKDN